jgi:type I restriction enzyme S subunit
MSEWIKTSLGDTISFSSGESLPKQNWEPGSVPVYGGNGISGYHRKSNINTIRLIIGRVGEHCGNAYITEEQSWVTDNALITSFKGEIHSLDFWQYLLSSLELRKQAYSSAQPVITGGILNRINVCLPPYEQQQKIAKILSTVDNLIEKTQSLIDKYTAIKQGMMADLFTRGIDMTTGTHCGKLRPSVEDAPDLYKQTELGWVPKDWDDTKLGKYIEKYLYGPRFDAGQYSIDGNVKTIRGTDFTKYGEILYEQVPIAEIPIGKIKHHILKQGDLVVITTADCGLTAVFEEQDYAYIPSAYAVKLKLIEGADPYFIKAYMQTDLAERQVNKYVRQGTLGNLPGSDLLDFFIAMPSLNEQQAIVSKLTSVEQLIVKEKFYLAKMHKKKKGLMQDLLTGKVQVS